MNICEKCGIINNDTISICENCGNEIDNSLIEKILPFAKNAVYYGYLYRVDYEKQVKEQGEVKIKYSLLEPSNYYELLAVFALSGYIGGVSFQLVNFIGKQIVYFIKGKLEKDKEDKEFVEFIEDEEKVKRFAKYINEYYTGKHHANKIVADAIIEEEMADFASHEKGEEFAEALKKYTPEEQGELLELFTEIAKGVSKKRREIIPQKDDLKNLFGDTKKTFVKEKKKNRKKKNKKRK